MFNSPLLDKKIVVFIIGIIIGFIILYFVNSNKSSSLNCNTTEKFTHNKFEFVKLAFDKFIQLKFLFIKI